MYDIALHVHIPYTCTCTLYEYICIVPLYQSPVIDRFSGRYKMSREEWEDDDYDEDDGCYDNQTLEVRSCSNLYVEYIFNASCDYFTLGVSIHQICPSLITHDECTGPVY